MQSNYYMQYGGEAASSQSHQTASFKTYYVCQHISWRRKLLIPIPPATTLSSSAFFFAQLPRCRRRCNNGGGLADDAVQGPWRVQRGLQIVDGSDCLPVKGLHVS